MEGKRKKEMYRHIPGFHWRPPWCDWSVPTRDCRWKRRKSSPRRRRRREKRTGEGRGAWWMSAASCRSSAKWRKIPPWSGIWRRLRSKSRCSTASAENYASTLELVDREIKPTPRPLQSRQSKKTHMMHDQSINQSIERSINQSINQSMERTFRLSHIIPPPPKLAASKRLIVLNPEISSGKLKTSAGVT